MSAYTPGQWTLESDREVDGRFRISAPAVAPQAFSDRDLVAKVYYTSGPTPRETGLANARLIVTAPRMAEILLSAWQHVTHGGPKRGDVEDVLREAGLI